MNYQIGYNTHCHRQTDGQTTVSCKQSMIPVLHATVYDGLFSAQSLHTRRLLVSTTSACKT